MIFERYRIDFERRPLGQLPADADRVRSQPRIAIDGIMVGGINDLLRMTRSRQLDEIAAGAPFAPRPRVKLRDRLSRRSLRRVDG